MGSAWEAFAPAKLNLYLEVLGRRDDGFHELETLMAPIRFYDRLLWAPGGPGGEFSLAYDPRTPHDLQRAAPPNAQNLAWRAAELLARTAGIEPAGSVTLYKRIPAQSGLGGGSSDAAAMLQLGNAAWRLGYSSSRLAGLAAQLGSDVPFFLAGGSAVCRGRGELVEPAKGLPRLETVIVKPPAGVSTAGAFASLGAGPVDQAAVADSRRRLARLLHELSRGSLAAAARWMKNSLQSSAAELCSWVERLKHEFAALGCYGHQLTGSGSAYFGIMRSARQARRAAAVLSSRNLGAVVTSATFR
jgi:4-diphosphocytidyl-2-C-methyl-D-erythritol kinase